MVRWLLLLLAIAYLAFSAVTYYRIERQSRIDELMPSDALVVFGAAEYSGRPSPVLRARLDHAYDLYRRGLGPVIITTGGSTDDTGNSEGSVGRDYLISRGVPEHSIIAETRGGSTVTSARRVAAIMKANAMRTCVAVSDDYHIFRIKQMLGREGIIARGAPRLQTSPQKRPGAFSWERFRLIMREVLSYTLWFFRLT